MSNKYVRSKTFFINQLIFLEEKVCITKLLFNDNLQFT